ncbi:MAG: hypothetical protein IT425_05000 [Pirellulales bacterium]|nr:hypothetical protein [Pirellulales bacterium]
MTRTTKYLVLIGLPVLLATLAPVRCRSQESPSLELAPKAKPVKLEPRQQEGLTSIRLDSEVFHGSTDSLSDLRLIDENEEETPFVLRKVVTDTKRNVRTLRDVADVRVKPLENDALEIEFHIDPAKYDKTIHGFRLATSLANFEHRVTIERRDRDSDEWVPLVRDALIYDYSQFMAVRNTDVAFPTDAPLPKAGYFRIRIDRVTQEQQSRWTQLSRTFKAGLEDERQERYVINRQPLHIQRINFWHDEERTVSSQPVLEEVALQTLDAGQDNESRTSWVLLESARQPISLLTLETTDRNFSREFQLAAMKTAEAPAKEGRPLGSSVLTKIDLAGLEKKVLELSLPETRERFYRVTVVNRDSPPLAELKFQAKGPSYDLVFLADPAHQYRLTYGVASREEPHYDTLALQTALAAGQQPLRATLGPETTFTPQQPKVRKLDWITNPWFLGGVIAILTILLTLALRQAARRLQDVPNTN